MLDAVKSNRSDIGQSLMCVQPEARLEQAEIAEAIRKAIALHADMTAAFLASGMHPSHSVEAAWDKGPGRILVAARDEFFRVGYHGTSTRDVAAAAGMSATAMYAHYPSKESMLFKLCLLGSGSALDVLRKAADPGVRPRSGCAARSTPSRLACREPRSRPRRAMEPGRAGGRELPDRRLAAT